MSDQYEAAGAPRASASEAAALIAELEALATRYDERGWPVVAATLRELIPLIAEEEEAAF